MKEIPIWKEEVLWTKDMLTWLGKNLEVKLMAITNPSLSSTPKLWKGNVDAAKNWQHSLIQVMVDVWNAMLPRAHEYNLQRSFDKHNEEGILQRRKVPLKIVYDVV